MTLTSATPAGQRVKEAHSLPLFPSPRCWPCVGPNCYSMSTADSPFCPSHQRQQFDKTPRPTRDGSCTICWTRGHDATACPESMS